MKMFQRASRLLKANINHLLDSAEDPEVMLKQLIHDMDEAVTELRRETVNAVARQKQLEKKVQAAGDRADELEKKAVLALENKDQDLARRILGERVETLKTRESLTDELRAAGELAGRLKTDLNRMEEQAGKARRKKSELIRRKRAAEARMRTQEAARKSADAMSAATGSLASGESAFDGYADDIGEMEARAEAARELSDTTGDDEAKLDKLVEASEVEKELERLKQMSAQ